MERDRMAARLNVSVPLSVSSSAERLAVLHILKRRMGLVKRGWLDREPLTLSAVSVSQTDAFTVSEGSDYVQLTVNTSRISTTRVGAVIYVLHLKLLPFRNSGDKSD